MTRTVIPAAVDLPRQPAWSLTGVVTIDGPAAAGKSTTAMALAQHFGAGYLDTGAIYRAVTWAALRAGVADADADRLVATVKSAQVRIAVDPAQQRVEVNGHRVDEEIRSDSVTEAVPRVAAVPAVRELVVQLQRRVIRECLTHRGSVVVEGRDIGTEVWPAAVLKVYLTASVQERARRRARQRGQLDSASVTAAEESLRIRDTRDRSRSASPLRKAPDAIEVDTTSMSVDEVVTMLRSLTVERSPKSAEGTQASGWEPAVGSAEYRRLFRRHAAGVVVVTADSGSGPAGFTATSLTSVSLKPPLVAFSVATTASVCPTILTAGRLVVNFLSADQSELARRFAASGVDRFGPPVCWSKLPTGEPVLDEVPAFLRGVSEAKFLVGDHHIVIVRAVEVNLRWEHEPLVYHDGSYAAVQNLDRRPES